MEIHATHRAEIASAILARIATAHPVSADVPEELFDSHLKDSAMRAAKVAYAYADALVSLTAKPDRLPVQKWDIEMLDFGGTEVFSVIHQGDGQKLRVYATRSELPQVLRDLLTETPTPAA